LDKKEFLQVKKKTKFIVFKPCQKRTNQNIQLLIDAQKIDQVKETVFLGVIMDENLNWKPEISHVANKVSKSIGIIPKSSFYLSTKTLRTLYFFSSLSVRFFIVT